MRTIELAPITEKPSDWYHLAQVIERIFKDSLYLPLIADLWIPKTKLIRNAPDHLAEAIRSGLISFDRGFFSGKFEAATSRELKRLGAVWDRSRKGWRIPAKSLPAHIRMEISASQAHMQQVMARIDSRLAKIVPAEIADQMKMEKCFETITWKADADIVKTMKGLVVPPQLTPHRAKRIAEEYSLNMDLYIKDWMKKEIIELRKTVQQQAFAGYRYEKLAKTIQRSYGVSQSKAKFLARQETNLLVVKLKEVRYIDAGVKQYRWQCVAGSKDHPVRPMHKALDGKVFSWDDPPITDKKGSRNNPGQDYNCRCAAIPIVKF